MINSRRTSHPTWMTAVLLVAGTYNMLWAGWVIFFPEPSLQLLGYSTAGAGPMFWQGTGMLVGVFGLGYAISAFDPARHWLMILIGLISKLLAGAGCIVGALSGTMPAIAGWLAIPNDLIWWIPFGLILRHAWQVGSSRPNPS